MPTDTGDIFAQMGLTPSADALVGQEMAARTAPVFPLPNVAAKSDMLPPAAPQMPQGGGGMALPPPMSAPALAPPAPRYEQPPIAAQPLPGEDPAVAQKEFMRRLGTALATNGSAAQRVQGLQMLAEAGQPTEAQQQARERQRLVNVIDMAPVDEATKHRAAIAAHLGAKPDEIMKSMGLDQPNMFGGAGLNAGSQPGGEEFLKTVPPALASTLKAIDEGRMAPPSSFALSKPYWQQVMAAMAVYNPSMDLTKWKTRNETYAAFNKGPEAKNVTSVATAMQHLETYVKAINDLHNSNTLPILNAPLNAVKEAASGAYQSKMNEARNASAAIVSELGRAFKGAAPELYDAKKWENSFPTSNSPEGALGSAKGAINLLRGRMETLMAQYNRGMDTSHAPFDIISPAAKRAMYHLGFDTDGTPLNKGAASVAAPAVGTVQQGHRFLGGDPADQRSWEPVQ